MFPNLIWKMTFSPRKLWNGDLQFEIFIIKQERIPVGCVPAVHWPSRGGVHPSRIFWGGKRNWKKGKKNSDTPLPRKFQTPPPGSGQVPPPPPVERHTPVNLLPWPNFVAAGNNNEHLEKNNNSNIYIGSLQYMWLIENVHEQMINAFAKTIDM